MLQHCNSKTKERKHGGWNAAGECCQMKLHNVNINMFILQWRLLERWRLLANYLNKKNLATLATNYAFS